MYQHYFLNVGFDFVPPQEHLSLKSYGLWQRFNPLGALFYPQMFYNDFGINLWETMTKTALFGQWDFSMRGADIMGLITADTGILADNDFTGGDYRRADYVRP